MATLTEYLATTQTSQRAFARKIEVSPGYLHDILNGRRTPSLAVALRIAAATEGGVPLDALAAPTQEAEARAAERGAA